MSQSQAVHAEQDLHRLRHSAAHVLAQAVKRLWPKTRLAIGPPIEDGFYYDVEPEQPILEEDLPRLEEEMLKVIKENHTFKQTFMSKPEANEFFNKRDERFKLEIIRDIPDSKVSIFTDGDFIDLCEGPHVEATGKIPAIKLLSVAGAYWRGNEKNPQLTRIYGTAFYEKETLDEFLKTREEAKKRDHRKLGTSLKLFSILEEAGAGFVFYRPRGATLRHLIEDYSRRQHAARGYVPVITPHVIRSNVWNISGHMEQYKQNMYIFESEGQEWGIKPMNCPGHILIYQTDLHSYRELPLRFFELGTVYRNEKSGVLHGLLRVRGFTQDDAHIFCRLNQLEEELGGILEFIQQVFKDFGFEQYKVEMSTRPPEFLGDTQQWTQAEEILVRTLKSKEIPYEISPGAGAFYGPKIDVHVKDTLGRYWQCATAQLDFVLPKRFNLKYIEQDGSEASPVMIHRAIFGSIERFIGTLIEHHGGAFPVWLAPVQAVVIPITDEQEPYAKQALEHLRTAGLRAEIDNRRETLQARIRDSQLEKIPYMLVAGKREAANQTLAVRARAQGDLGAMSLPDFIARISQEIQEKK